MKSFASLLKPLIITVAVAAPSVYLAKKSMLDNEEFKQSMNIIKNYGHREGQVQSKIDEIMGSNQSEKFKKNMPTAYSSPLEAKKFNMGDPKFIKYLKLADNYLKKFEFFNLPLMLQIINSLAIFGSAWILWLLMASATSPPWYRVTILAGYLFGNYLTYNATQWSTNTFVMSLIVFSFIPFLKGIGRYPFDSDDLIKSFKFRQLLTCGLIISFTISVRPFAISVYLAYALALAAIQIRDKSQIFGPQVCLAIMPITSFAMQFGQSYFMAHLKKHELNLSQYFSVPLHVGLFGSLLWPAKSYLLLVPFSIFSIGGFYRLFQNSKAIAIPALLIVTAYFLCYSKWWSWNAGETIGQIFWIPTIPFIAISLAFLKSKYTHAVVVIAVIFGIYTQYQLKGLPNKQLYSLTYQRAPYGERRVHEALKQGIKPVMKHTFSQQALLQAAKTLQKRSQQ